VEWILLNNYRKIKERSLAKAKAKAKAWLKQINSVGRILLPQIMGGEQLELSLAKAQATKKQNNTKKLSASANTLLADEKNHYRGGDYG
jgi:hypothetical protein